MIYLPSREIVLPERCRRCGGWIDRRRDLRPFWRGGVRAWNTAGKFQHKAATGKLQRSTTTGKMRRNTATNTACCCGLCGCTSVPTSWTVSTSTAIDLTTACTDGGPTASSGKINGASTYSGTFSLTLVAFGGGCFWSYGNATPGFTADYYLGTGCGGSSTAGATQIQINLTVAGNVPTVDIAIINPSQPGQARTRLFSGTGGTCSGATGLSNTISTSVVTYNPLTFAGDLGTGGVVDLTAVP